VDTPMRVLLDTNIFISFLLSPPQSGGTIQRLIEAVTLGEAELILPEELIEELERKLMTSPKLVRRIAPEESREFIALLRSVAIIPAPVTGTIPAVVRDPKDDFLLAYALLHGADSLISRDKDRLVLGEIDGLMIVSPHQFVTNHLGGATQE
jgi:uncharacterized protein